MKKNKLNKIDYEKKQIRDITLQLSIEDLFDGKTVGDVINQLTELNNKYSNPENIVKFYVSYYGYDGGQELYLETYRQETDNEYQKRIQHELAIVEKAERARKEKQARALAQILKTEKQERELYEELKKKFG